MKRGHTICLRLGLVALACLLNGTAFAQGPLPAPLPDSLQPESKSDAAPSARSALDSFASENPACTEIRNGCIVCTKTEQGRLGCSNVGIACVDSGAWRCTSSVARDLGPR